VPVAPCYVVAAGSRVLQLWAVLSYTLSCTSLVCSIGARLLPRRVCCAQRSARLGQHAQAPEQAQGDTAPIKNSCDKQVSSWRHISCHTDKNRYYT
jgi:hypothetical protein